MLDHIDTLATLADAGTMTRAATRLRLSQSSVSKRIAALEREVGRKLVEAQGRGVRLTPAGQRLLERTAVPLPSSACAPANTRSRSVPAAARKHPTYRRMCCWKKTSANHMTSFLFCRATFLCRPLFV